MDEQILIRMGLDQRPLVNGLQGVGGKVANWSKNTADQVGRQFGRMGAALVSAFSVQKIISNLRTVADEIDKLYAHLDSARYKSDQRAKQLRGMDKSSLETIVAGDVQTSNLGGKIKNFLAWGAGTYAWAGSTLAEAFKKGWETKDPLQLIFGLGEASQRAAAKQQAIIEGIHQAAVEAAATESTTAQKKAEAESNERYWKQRLDQAEKHVKEREQARERHEKEMVRYKEQQLKLSQAIADAGADASAARSAYGQAFGDLSASSLGDIANSTAGYWRYNPMRFRKEWVGPPGQQAAQQVQQIEDQARRAAMFGNKAEAEKLTSRALEMRRNSIPGLSQSERDPLGAERAKLEKSQLEVNELMLKSFSANGGLLVEPKD
jgi:hypothetical protein